VPTSSSPDHRDAPSGRKQAPAPAPAPAPTLHLLGAFHLVDADGAPQLGAGKPLAVLAYLACARNRRGSRSVVADLLWGDSVEAQRRGSLRQALFTLRHHLGPDAIYSDGEWLELAAPLHVDAERFVHAVEARRYTDAVAAYSGPFIPQFAAPGAAEFERWADMERMCLQGSFLAAAVQSLRDQIGRGDVDAALALSERMVEESPEDDAMWRRRFDVLSLAGRAGQLLLEISSLRARRADDGRPLDPSLERFIAQLVGSLAVAKSRGEDAAPPGALPDTLEFQGRAEVFTALLAAWAKAAAGVPQRMLVVGAPGIGKTRLLQELARRLATRRVQVVTIASRQRERDDPFALLADVVGRLSALPGAAGVTPGSAAVLAGVVPSLADGFSVSPVRVSLDNPTLWVQHGQALADLLTAVGEEAPLVLLLDDLHWADRGSLDVIERALARVGKVPLLVIASSRFATPDLGCGDARVTLGPLALDEIAALMCSVAEPERGGEFDTMVAAVHRVCAGVPFHVVRLLHEAVSDEALRIIDGHWRLGDADAWQRLLDRSSRPEARLQAYSHGDRALLALLAMADAPVTTADLEMVGETPSAAVGVELSRLEQLGLVLRDAGARWSLAHALIAEDARASVPPEDWRRMARALGERLSRDVEDLGALRRAVRLLLEGGEIEAARALAVRWYAAQRVMPFSADGFVEALRGAGGDAELHRSLRRALLWRRRWWRSRPAVAVGSALLTLSVAAAWALQPVTLVSTSQLDPTTALSPFELYPVPPRVEVRNRLGWRSTRRDGDVVQAGLRPDSLGLRGRTSVIVRHGEAVFDSLFPPKWEAGSELRFTMSRLPPLVLAARHDVELLVESVHAAGQRVVEAPYVLRVARGAPIEGEVRLHYTTLSRDAVWALAQTTTWGVAPRDTLTVRSLLAGISDAIIDVPLRLRAPATIGDYWILWTTNLEPAAAWLLSGTNWQCGQPVWGDGNDLAALPDSVLARAVAQGRTVLPFLYCNYQPPYREPRIMPVAGVRVEVR